MKSYSARFNLCSLGKVLTFNPSGISFLIYKMEGDSPSLRGGVHGLKRIVHVTQNSAGVHSTELLLVFITITITI